MARELIEVNPNDEPAVPLRSRADRGRELTVRTSAGYREESSSRSHDSGDSPSPNSSKKIAERARKRAAAVGDIDDDI
ncbi:MAG TPA: hypothetical protein VFY05_09665, partial [Candidatus Angelobacter sp.]|nr:hypothetical protein [Candidatus Angelobacter sp.]